ARPTTSSVRGKERRKAALRFSTQVGVIWPSEVQPARSGGSSPLPFRASRPVVPLEGPPEVAPHGPELLLEDGLRRILHSQGGRASRTSHRECRPLARKLAQRVVEVPRSIVAYRDRVPSVRRSQGHGLAAPHPAMRRCV